MLILIRHLKLYVLNYGKLTFSFTTLMAVPAMQGANSSSGAI